MFAVSIKMRQSKRTLGIAAAISAITAFGFAMSAVWPLLSLVLAARGHSTDAIGLSAGLAGAGALASSFLTLPIARRFGFLTTLLGALILCALSLPLFHLIPSFWAWIPLRFTFHVLVTGVFILAEIWITLEVEDKHRGIVLGIYGTALSVGLATGPLILKAFGTVGGAPFYAIAACLLLAVLPVLLGRRAAPKLTQPAKSRLLPPLTMPAVLLCSFVFAAVDLAFTALMPIYGLHRGFSPENAALVLAMFPLGSILLQIPLGYVADRIPRIYVLQFCAVGGVLLPILMYALPLSLSAFLALIMLWGGLLGGLYTVALALLAQNATPDELPDLNAAFVLWNTLGMVAGPVIAGGIMSTAGTPALPLGFSGFAAILLCVLLFSARNYTQN